MKIAWKRGNTRISFNVPSVWFVLGARGSGKSSLLEHLGENYLEHQHAVFDLFGSRDGENLAWLRSPHVQDKRVLLVKGDNVDVNCSWEIRNVASLTVQDLDRYDIIISSSPFYINIDQEFQYAAKLTDLLYKRIHWRKLLYVIVREAANLYYSRLKVSENQTLAKSQMVYFIRESRHFGAALGMDSLRYYAIDIDLRNVSDYTFFKSQGVLGLSRDLKWLYKYFDPRLVRDMPANYFILVTRIGCLGYGVFPEIPWHKKEGEDLIRKLDFKIEYGEPLKESVFRGTFTTVSDKEHAEIIRKYVEGLSMIRIAELMSRSSRTVALHVHTHDMKIEESGECDVCKRVGGQFNVKAVKPGGAKSFSRYM